MAGAYGKIRLFPTSLEYFVVGGGAGGGTGRSGNHNGGGGGAGGVLTGSASIGSGKSLVVNVGAGGASATSGSNSSVQIVSNINNNSVYFDGSGDFLSIADNPNLELGSSNFTIEAWIYLTTASGEKGIVSKYSTGNVGYTVRYSASSGGIRSVFGNSGGATDIWVETWTPSANIWYHVAFVRSSNSYYVFVNGTQLGSTRTFTNAITIGDTSDVFVIGTTQTVASSDFAGYMSNVRLIKGTALYTSNFTPPTSPLTAITNTSLLTCQSSTIRDNSTNNFAITTNGNATVFNASPFPADYYSVYFDGNGDFLTASASSSFDVMNDNFTIEFFVNFASLSTTGQQHHLVQTGTGSTNRNTIYLRRADSKICLYTVNGGTGSDIIVSNITCVVGTLYHVALVKSSTTFSLYINGVLQNTSTSSTYSSGVAQSLAIGYQTFSGVATDYLHGYISNVRIVKGTALYTANFTPPTSPLTAIANTSLLTCQSSTIRDESSNNFTITVNGNTIVSNLAPATNIITLGGGAGGGVGLNPTTGFAGGSGGGGSGSGNNPWAGGAGTVGQGTTGGTGNGTGSAAGGGGAGGGSGFPLVDGTASVSGNGGPGLQFPIFTNGYSVYFDGTGDYLTLPTGSTALAFGNSNFTVEAWVYRISGTGPATIFVGQSDLTTVAGSSYVFYIASSHTADLYVGGTAYTITSPNPPLGSWNHVAWVRNGGTFTSYLNGVQVGNRTDLGTNSVNVGSATAPPAIGAFSNGNNSLIGYISNLRLVKGTALYTSNFTPPTSPLTAITNTSLLTCQNSTIRDNSSNNFSITVSNAVARQSGPFNLYGINSYSVYFDGNGDFLTVPSNAAFGFGTGDFTIEGWIYAVSGATNKSFIDFRLSGGGSSQLKPTIYFASDLSLTYMVSSTSRISGTLVANTWVHVAVSKSSGNTRMFFNGTQVGSTYSDNNDYGANSPCVIGTVGDSPGFSSWTGFISDVRVIKGTALYTSNFTPSTSPLTAITNTSLLTCQNPTIRDNSSNNFTITANGNSTPAIHNPFLENTYYAAGGGGAGTPGIGGLGGGGTGGGSIAPTAGRTNSGSGGGGGTASGSTPGGAGGSGTVIIRLPAGDKLPTSILGSYTMVVSEGFRIYQWTSSGSMTF